MKFFLGAGNLLQIRLSGAETASRSADQRKFTMDSGTGPFRFFTCVKG